jgi:hypothetical protein
MWIICIKIIRVDILPHENPSVVHTQDWLHELARHFEEIGLVRNGVIEDTVAKLRVAGIREHQLRNISAEEILKKTDILIGARKAILLRYQSTSSHSFPSTHRVSYRFQA